MGGENLAVIRITQWPHEQESIVYYSVDKSVGPQEVAVIGQVAAFYSGRNPKVQLYMHFLATSSFSILSTWPQQHIGF